MSNIDDGFKTLSNKMTEILVKDIFKKNGITQDKLNPISEKEKKELKDLYYDIKKQLDELEDNPKSDSSPVINKKKVNSNETSLEGSISKDFLLKKRRKKN